MKHNTNPIKIRQVILIILLLATELVAAQSRFTLSGYVREKGSRELLPGVNVYLAEQRMGTITNNYGFYSITVPAGQYEFQYSFVGYQPVIIRVDLTQSRMMDIELEASITLGEVVVSAEKQERITESNQMSLISLPVMQVKSIPALLGEKDVFKALQLMPGVQKGSEGSSGLYVRGGGPDQNLIILDDAVVYNAYHLFGFFSIFNGDALKSIELTKGGFPARFGGRLSSVVEMTMKDGNKEKLSGEAGIGIIASRLVLEGPLKKNKSSFLVSARRTYLDVLTRPLMPEEGKGGYYFYDLNAKVNYDFGPKNKIYLSGYFGRDKFYFKTKDNYSGTFEGGLYWQNRTATFRWNHLFNNRVFSNTSLIYSEYDLNIYNKIKSRTENYRLTYESGIRDWSLKYDLEYHASPIYKLRTGLQAVHHHFLPNAIVEVGNQYLNLNRKTEYNSVESAVYAENHFTIASKLFINAGLRLSHFYADGKTYFSPEPRFSANYLLREGTSLKAAFATMNQYIHLLSNTGIGLPTDLWVPSTARIAPQQSHQVSAGFAQEFIEQGFQLTVEGYYKKSNNILGYKPGSSFLLIDDPTDAQNFTWQDNVTSGKGESYGAEILLHRKTGRTSGWIGYTLSWTQLQFDEINFGKKFWARHDRRHDISLVVIHEISKNITLSGAWVYGTGNAVTLPLATYSANPHNPFEWITANYGSYQWYYFYEMNDYGPVNDFRMKAYHRLDLAIQLHKKLEKHERTWEIGIYNAYSRRNPFFYYIDTDYLPNGNMINRLKQVSLFPMIPAVTYNIKF